MVQLGSPIWGSLDLARSFYVADALDRTAINSGRSAGRGSA
jgi:hypothetical protein